MEDLMQMMQAMKEMPPEMQARLMQQLSMGPEAMSDKLGVHGVDLELYGTRRTRQQIIQAHQACQNQFKMIATNKWYSTNLGLPTHSIKPSTASLARTSELLPIHISSMQVGTTHRERLLRGQLIVHPIPHNAVQSIIEDELGDVSVISFYNVSNDDKKRMSLLRRGTKVIVCEPFYKLCMDGNLGVRIDNFKDVIIVDRVGPLTGDDVVDWKDEAKRHFNANHFSEAARCYRVVLSKYDADVIAVLNNTSAAYKCSGKPWAALHYAMAAVGVDPSNFKANYRVAEALESLELVELALHYCKEASGLLGDGAAAPCDEMRTRLQRLKKKKTVKPADPVREVVCLMAENATCLGSSKKTDNDSKTLTELKQTGNDFYREGNYERAVDSYNMAIKCEQGQDVAVLLSNLSACTLGLNQFVDAAMHATAATVINPEIVKGHYRRGTALLKIDMPTAALSAIQAAPMKDKTLDDLRCNVQQRIAEQCGGDTATKSHRQGQTEREAKQLLEKDSAGTDDIAMLNNVMSMMSGFDVDDRVVAFHERFARDGHWPFGSDIPSCQEKLREAFEYARNAKFKETLMFSDEDGFNSLRQKNMIMRIGPDRNVALRLLTSQPGTVLFSQCPPYSVQTIHGFSNQPQTPIQLTFGTTHVAVAFVDLGELLAASIVGSEESALRWVGYEASEYSVAKTLVVADMLATKAPVLDVFQIWYSSTWTRQAFQSFRRSLIRVLENNGKNYDARVQRVLKHWKAQTHGVSLADARRCWLESHPGFPVVIANFKSEADRSAMCSYVISGI